MTLTEFVPLLSAIALVLAVLVIGLRPADRPADWRIPAALFAAFLVYTVVVGVLEGPLAFIPNHTQDLWGNQVWIDLLIGMGVGYGFTIPRARALGMKPLPWVVLLLPTGCVGLLGLLARVLYLESQQPSPAGT